MIAIRVGYTHYIMENEKAVQLAVLLEEAEIFTSKYHRGEDGADSYQTFHVYPSEESFTMELIPQAKYQLAKLAGKPSND